MFLRDLFKFFRLGKRIEKRKTKKNKSFKRAWKLEAVNRLLKKTQERIG